jgi:Protein of unknown function (DUF3667)
MEQTTVTCKNCGHVFIGNYCNACGEKIYHDHHKKTGHLLEEVFHFLTHFEGSFITTLKTVFTKPGKYSLDYCNGIRKKYFKPVSYFMLLVVLYLLFPRFQGLNMKLDTYINPKYSFSWAAVPLVKKELKEKNIKYAEFVKLYDSKSSSISKIALFFLIPLASCVILLLFFTSRKYFFDHFILSLELSGLFIALHFLIVPFISFVAELIYKPWASFFVDDNYWLTYLQLIIDLVFISFAFKRFYGQNWWWTIPKALIYLFIFNMFILYVYRLFVLAGTLLLT